SASCEATTAGNKLTPVLAAALVACAGESSGPPPPASPRIDYVDGALEPILERGRAVVIEGLGFGAVQGGGAVTFARAGGGGGAEQISGALVPDSGVYVARAQAAGLVGPWVRQHDAADFTSRVLPAPRAFAAAAVATRYNSRFAGSGLYVIGGIDGAGRAQAS